MITISQAVEEIINHSPFLTEVLYEDMANITGVARQLRPQVEKKLLIKVSEEAIAMALHRIKKKLKPPTSGIEVLKDTKNITICSNLIEFVISNSPDIGDIRRVGYHKFNQIGTYGNVFRIFQNFNARSGRFELFLDPMKGHGNCFFRYFDKKLFFYLRTQLARHPSDIGHILIQHLR